MTRPTATARSCRPGAGLVSGRFESGGSDCGAHRELFLELSIVLGVPCGPRFTATTRQEPVERGSLSSRRHDTG